TTLLSHPQLSIRSTNTSDPLAIRGAARNTVIGRMRRNAVSSSSQASPSNIPVRMSTRTAKTVETWREVVKKRWNPELGLLDLSNLIEDPIIKKNNLLPPGHGGTAREAAVMFKIASQLKPEVQSLDLSKNNLIGSHLSLLGHYLPRLANLSLKDNSIRNYRELDSLSGKKEKLINLRELIMAGNPLREEEIQKGLGDKFKQEVTRRFASLSVLDGETITQIAFDVPQASSSSASAEKPSATTFPLEMGPSFIVGVDGGLLSGFLARFFSVLDNQRSALREVYDPAATFSYSCNTSIPDRARIQAFHHRLPNQKKLEWSPWLSGSRNLVRLANSIEKQEQRLFVGGEAIAKCVEGLPKTRHDISGPPEKFCVDCFPVVHAGMMGLLVTIHGEFIELPMEGVRSFDRTFILIPAPDGSNAKLNGWDVLIISDQWTVRGYSEPEAWKPGPMIVQPDPTSSRSMTQSQQQGQPPQPIQGSTLPPDQQAALTAIPEPQHSMVVQICARTGLNIKYAVECLTGNGWDVEKAVANFNEVKVGLVPNILISCILCLSHFLSRLDTHNYFILSDISLLFGAAIAAQSSLPLVSPHPMSECSSLSRLTSVYCRSPFCRPAWRLVKKSLAARP
ncbi:NTF2-like protein, partial [Dendrothele bispora CBS 962.96]